MVVERQRLLVLDGAKQGEFTGIDGQHAAGAKGVWIARARLPGGRDGHTGHRVNKQCNDEAHPVSRTSATHEWVAGRTYEIEH